MANIKLDFSSHSSYQIEIGDGIPDLSQLKKGFIIVNQKRGQMTWSQLSFDECTPDSIFKHRADLFLDDQQSMRKHVQYWVDNDLKKRCLFFLKNVPIIFSNKGE